MCDQTRKRIYPSPAAAQSVIDGWVGPFGPDRAYACSHCDGWHLTSQSLDELLIPEMEWRAAMAVDSTAGKKRRASLAQAMARADSTAKLIFGCKTLDYRLIVAAPMGDSAKEKLLILADDAAARFGLRLVRASFPLVPSRALIELTGFVRNPGGCW